MFLVDSHCHLDLLKLSPDESIDQLLNHAQQQGVQYLLNVCVSIAAFGALIKHAEKYPFVSASVGLHPNEQDEETDVNTLIKLGNHEKVVAVGETGLDYFRSTGDLSWQVARFRTHIEAAKSLQKPLIVHTRAAKKDTIKVLQEEKAREVSGVMHCFTEDWETAKAALDMGFYISFSGIVTFKNAAPLQEVAKLVPLDRMLIETDAPYLAPEPNRGESNKPAYLYHTAAFLAKLRNVSLDDFAEQTTRNFFQLFKGAKRPHV